jgi:hypothetical protein
MRDKLQIEINIKRNIHIKLQKSETNETQINGFTSMSSR